MMRVRIRLAWRRHQESMEDLRSNNQLQAEEADRSITAVPSDDHRWLSLVDECVSLYDELAERRPSFDANCQALADHVCTRLQEGLQHGGIGLISGEARFDPQRHRIHPSPRGVRPGHALTATVRPGFALGTRVLRRADVSVADPPVS